MGSYYIGLQSLNHPTTPFSTSWKVLQSYNLFPNQPNFFLDFFCSKSMAFASQKYGTYGSKPWEFWVKSMGVTLRFRYAGISEIRIRFARQQTTDNGHTTATRSLVVL